jgi:NAD(P)-dependent dehydrogenase (short-subunit alcohol dehydrogenase family)
MNLALAGKRCIVTGASRGIGAAVARELALERADIALLARDAGRLDALASELSGEGVRAFAVPQDLSSATGASAAMEAAIAGLGGVDVLVNAAGASPFGTFDRIDDADWQASFDLKVMSYVRCSRAAVAAMRSGGGGRIINIVGMAGRYARASYVLGALNAALLHLTKSLAELVATDGITVVAVNPGLTATDRMHDAMATWAEEAGQDVEAYERGYAASIPVGRSATAVEVARIVTVLASDIAGYVTGSSVEIDGGAAQGVF